MVWLHKTEVHAVIPLAVIYYIFTQLYCTHRMEVDVIEQLVKVDFSKNGLTRPAATPMIGHYRLQRMQVCTTFAV